MRIVVHTINYSPELTGIGKYTTEMCEWLAARGHQVTVIAPPPYYPQWRVPAPFSAWRYATSVIEKVRVRRAPIWMPRCPGGLARIAYALSFALSSFPVLLKEASSRPDLVMVIQPSFLNSPLAWLASRLAGARSWLHVQDFEIDLAYDLKQLTRGRAFASAIEAWMLKRFDVVSCISERMLDRAHAKGVEARRLFLLPNWFDAASIFPLRGANPFRAQLGIPEDAAVLLFSGSLGAKQGVEMILQAAASLTDLPLHFVICGEGVAEGQLKSVAAGAPNVHFLPLQPIERLNTLLNLADVHLLPQRQGAVHSVFPSKLIGMLASGKPVVAMTTPDSEIAQLIKGCGQCVDHGDIDGFARAIRNLVAQPEARREMGKLARLRAMERFRQDLLLRAMEEQFMLHEKPSRKPAAAQSGEPAPQAGTAPRQRAAAASDRSR